MNEAVNHLTDGPFGVGDGVSRLIALGAKTLPVLQRMVERRDIHDRDALAALLQVVSSLKTREGESLVQSIERVEPSLEMEALLALADIKSPTAISRLRTALQASSSARQTFAIEGMRRLGEQAAVRDLLALLERPDRPAMSLSTANVDLRPGTLHGRAAAAIDSQTGQHLAGDPNRIRRWISMQQK